MADDADALFRTGQFEQAGRAYEQILQADPTNLHAARQRGHVGLLANKFALSVPRWEATRESFYTGCPEPEPDRDGGRGSRATCSPPFDYAGRSLILRRRTPETTRKARAGASTLPMWLAREQYLHTVGSFAGSGPRDGGRELRRIRRDHRWHVRRNGRVVGDPHRPHPRDRDVRQQPPGRRLPLLSKGDPSRQRRRQGRLLLHEPEPAGQRAVPVRSGSTSPTWNSTSPVARPAEARPPMWLREEAA